MQKDRMKSIFKAGGIVCFLFAFFCVGLLVSTLSVQEVVEHQIEQKKWNLIPLGENNPGAGSGSGVLRCYVVHHGHFTYTANITVNATVYSAGETNNTHHNSTVPFGVAHDIVYKVRFNATHAWNSTAPGSWELDWCRGNITSPYHGATLEAMDEYHIANNSNFMWIHYVYDGTEGEVGAGVTIGRGDNSTINRCHLYAFY